MEGRAHVTGVGWVHFTQLDPIGLAGGLNLYGFASGDPVNFGDPFGLCASGSGGGGGSSGGSGSQESTDEKSECQQLAERAGQIAAGSGSIDEFGERIGSELAGVSNIADLRGGGRNMIPRTTGGYRQEFGGDTPGQARHFAASAFAASQYGRAVAAAGFGYNETMRPGANQEDWNLSVVAFDMMGALDRGRRGQSNGLRLQGGSVMNWILRNVCKPKQ